MADSSAEVDATVKDLHDVINAMYKLLLSDDPTGVKLGAYVDVATVPIPSLVAKIDNDEERQRIRQTLKEIYRAIPTGKQADPDEPGFVVPDGDPDNASSDSEDSAIDDDVGSRRDLPIRRRRRDASQPEGGAAEPGDTPSTDQAVSVTKPPRPTKPKDIPEIIHVVASGNPVDVKSDFSRNKMHSIVVTLLRNDQEAFNHHAALVKNKTGVDVIKMLQEAYALDNVQRMSNDIRALAVLDHLAKQVEVSFLSTKSVKSLAFCAHQALKYKGQAVLGQVLRMFFAYRLYVEAQALSVKVREGKNIFRELLENLPADFQDNGFKAVLGECNKKFESRRAVLDKDLENLSGMKTHPDVVRILPYIITSTTVTDKIAEDLKKDLRQEMHLGKTIGVIIKHLGAGTVFMLPKRMLDVLGHRANIGNLDPLLKAIAANVPQLLDVSDQVTVSVVYPMLDHRYDDIAKDENGDDMKIWDMANADICTNSMEELFACDVNLLHKAHVSHLEAAKGAGVHGLLAARPQRLTRSSARLIQDDDEE